MLNVQEARRNMLTQQLRTWEISDNRILTLINRLPREQFVPEAYRDLAYADVCIPLGHDEHLLPPKELARVLEALTLTKHDKVLEVGTGFGYVTALLATLGKHVFSVSAQDELTKKAQHNIAELDLKNVTFEVGNALKGWQAHAPYDVIVVNGSLPKVPTSLRDQLSTKGRLFVIMGDSPVMEAVIFRRQGKKSGSIEALFETDVPRAPGAQESDKFVF